MTLPFSDMWFWKAQNLSSMDTLLTIWAYIRMFLGFPISLKDKPPAKEKYIKLNKTQIVWYYIWNNLFCINTTKRE